MRASGKGKSKGKKKAKRAATQAASNQGIQNDTSATGDVQSTNNVSLPPPAVDGNGTRDSVSELRESSQKESPVYELRLLHTRENVPPNKRKSKGKKKAKRAATQAASNQGIQNDTSVTGDVQSTNNVSLPPPAVDGDRTRDSVSELRESSQKEPPVYKLRLPHTRENVPPNTRRRKGKKKAKRAATQAASNQGIQNDTSVTGDVQSTNNVSLPPPAVDGDGTRDSVSELRESSQKESPVYELRLLHTRENVPPNKRKSKGKKKAKRAATQAASNQGIQNDTSATADVRSTNNVSCPPPAVNGDVIQDSVSKLPELPQKEPTEFRPPHARGTMPRHIRWTEESWAEDMYDGSTVDKLDISIQEANDKWDISSCADSSMSPLCNVVEGTREQCSSSKSKRKRTENLDPGEIYHAEKVVKRSCTLVKNNVPAVENSACAAHKRPDDNNNRVEASAPTKNNRSKNKKKTKLMKCIIPECKKKLHECKKKIKRKVQRKRYLQTHIYKKHLPLQFRSWCDTSHSQHGVRMEGLRWLSGCLVNSTDLNALLVWMQDAVKSIPHYVIGERSKISSKKEIKQLTDICQQEGWSVPETGYKLYPPNSPAVLLRGMMVYIMLVYLTPSDRNEFKKQLKRIPSPEANDGLHDADDNCCEMMEDRGHSESLQNVEGTLSEQDETIQGIESDVIKHQVIKVESIPEHPTSTPFPSICKVENMCEQPCLISVDENTRAQLFSTQVDDSDMPVKTETVKHSSSSDNMARSLDGIDCLFNLEKSRGRIAVLNSQSTINDLIAADVGVRPDVRVRVCGGVNVFCNPTTYPENLSCPVDGFKTAIGIHPRYIDHVDEETFRRFRILSADIDCAALGPVGLDHTAPPSKWKRQQEVLVGAIQWCPPARPVIITVRDNVDRHCGTLYTQLYRLVSQLLSPMQPIHLHDFSGSPDQVIDWARLPNCYFAFTSAVMRFDPCQKQALQCVPDNRLLISTNSPACQPWYVNRNTPAFIGDVAAMVAQVRRQTTEFVLASCNRNARDLYQL